MSDYGPMQDLTSEDGQDKYNLCFSLTEAELDKLELDGSPEPGDYIHACFLGRVTNVNKGADEDGKPTCRIEVVMEAMGLHDESHEAIDETPIDARLGSALYG